MLDIMFYMTHYPDVLHHPREDLAFAKIKERDKSAGATVDELSEQHAQLRRLGEELVRGLGDIVNGSIASRESVETPGRAYVANFRSHMRTEEKEILPMAATAPPRQGLVRDQWRRLQHIDDPLFGKAAEKRYAAIHRQIARQAQAAKAAAP